jgi:small subunit ribosomal protein S6
MPKFYETVVVVDAMIPDESIASEFDAITKQIEGQGKLLRVDRWGKRKLAYPIKKRSHGEYAIFYYKSEPSLPAEIEKRLRINENALRWLTVAENPVGLPPERVEEEAKSEDAAEVVGARKED